MNDQWLKEAKGFNTVLDIARAYLQTETLTASINLGIFDALATAQQPMSARALAEENKLDVDGTESLANACVGLGLLTRTVDELGEGVYTNTALTTKWLLKSSANSMVSFLCAEDDDVMNLEESVRTGKCQWHKKERNAEETLDYNEVMDVKSEEDKDSFFNLFHHTSGTEAPFTSTAFDLSRFTTICDLGGCTGAFLQTCAKNYPDNKLILLDLPAVIDSTAKYMDNGYSHRIERIKGDIFKDSLPVADLYVLSRILHDWNKKTDLVNTLLTKIFQTLPAGGGLLIIECLLDEDRTGPLRALLQSVLMTCVQEGKEMAASEYTTLLEGVGFRDVQFKTTPYVGVMLAIKPHT